MPVQVKALALLQWLPLGLSQVKVPALLRLAQVKALALSQGSPRVLALALLQWLPLGLAQVKPPAFLELRQDKVLAFLELLQVKDLAILVLKHVKRQELPGLTQL